MRFIFVFLLYTNILLSVDFITGGSVDIKRSFNNNNNVSVVDISLHNDVHFKNSKLASSIGVYSTNNSVYNNNVKNNVPRSEVLSVNELYYTQYLNKGLSVSLGLFPFKKGTFYEHSYNGNRSGIGLYTLTDANLEGGIVTYTSGRHTFQIGGAWYEKYFRTYKDYVKTDSEINFDSYKDSGMEYIAYKYNRDKWYSELMFTKMDQFVNGYKIIDTDTYSLALSYDDEVDSGRTYYGVYTRTFTQGDTSSMSPIGKPTSNSYYHFDKFKTSGHSLLLGIKQELDRSKYTKDMVIGFEYLKRTEGYHSLLAGEPLSYDNYSNIGESFNSYVGLRLNKDMLLKFRYFKYYDNGKMTKPFLTTVPVDSVEGCSSGNYSTYTIELYFEF